MTDARAPPVGVFHVKHLVSSEQESIPVMRGQWFVDGTWLPLEEEDSNPIEMEHLSHFRGQQMRDVSEVETAPSTVDSKDGKMMTRKMGVAQSLCEELDDAGGR